MSEMLTLVAEIRSSLARLEAMMSVVDAVAPKRGRPALAKTEDKPKKPLSDGMKAWHEFNARIDTLLKANEAKFKRVAEAKQFASKLKKAKATGEWTDDEILAERASWTEEHPVEDKEESSSDGEKKKAGRPKKTDEQKAADKAAREAAAAAMTSAEKKAAADKKAAAKAARDAKKVVTEPVEPVEPVEPIAEPVEPVAKKATKSAPDAPKKPVKKATKPVAVTKIAWAEEELDDELSSVIDAVSAV